MDSNHQPNRTSIFKQIISKIRHLIRHLRNSPRASLHTIPPELVLSITDFLPSRDIISLSHTCQKFYRHSPLRIENLFDRFHSAGESKARRSDQKAYKDLLSSKKLSCRPKTKKLFCASCSEYHPYSSFSITAQREPSEKRRCRDHEGCLWMCPFQVWTSAQIASFQSKDDTAIRPWQPFASWGPCQCMQHFTVTRASGILQIFPLGNFDQQNPISYRKIKRLLNSCHIRICPHHSISDVKVLADFDASCTRTFDNHTSDCECRACHHFLDDDSRMCGECATSFFIRRRNETNGSITLYLLVLVFFLPIKDDLSLTEEDRALWENVKTLPSEFQGRTEEWKTYNVYPEDAPIPRDQILAPNRDPYNKATFHWD